MNEVSSFYRVRSKVFSIKNFDETSLTKKNYFVADMDENRQVSAEVDVRDVYHRQMSGSGVSSLVSK